jgi:hypothetical protein
LQGESLFPNEAGTFTILDERPRVPGRLDSNQRPFEPHSIRGSAPAYRSRTLSTARSGRQYNELFLSAAARWLGRRDLNRKAIATLSRPDCSAAGVGSSAFGGASIAATACDLLASFSLLRSLHLAEPTRPPQAQIVPVLTTSARTAGTGHSRCCGRCGTGYHKRTLLSVPYCLLSTTIVLMG